MCLHCSCFCICVAVTGTACCAEAGQSGNTCALNYTNNWDDMLPFYVFFKQSWPQGRILIYSGDTDIATCPHAYAQLCISELGWPVQQSWAPWNVSSQVAGYVEVFDGSVLSVCVFAIAEYFFLSPLFIFGVWACTERTGDVARGLHRRARYFRRLVKCALHACGNKHAAAIKEKISTTVAFTKL